MKTVFDIFKSDIRAIVKYIFVLVIVLALGVLPSLYAWVNIYANWDPYSETGNVQVALSSRDHGIELRNGEHVNRASEIISDAKSNENIAYRPLDDPDEAIEGVKSGRFYAAVIFEEGFTYDMQHFEEAVGNEQPRITYYTNIKKNAVASKITDSVAQNLLSHINSTYLKSMLDQYFGDADKLAREIDTEEAVDTALEQLNSTRDAIHDFNLSITGIMAAKGDVTKALGNARSDFKKGRKQSRSDISKAKKRIDSTKKSIQSVSQTIDGEKAKLKTAISSLKSSLAALQGPIAPQRKQELAEEGLEKADRVLTILENMRSMLPESPRTVSGRAAANAMDAMIMDADHIRTLLQNSPDLPDIAVEADSLNVLLNKNLTPSLDLMISDIESAIERIEPVLSSSKGILNDIDPVIDGAETTVESLDSSLAGLQATLVPLEEKLDDIISKVENAKDGDKATLLADLLRSDAGQYSQFFSNPVEIETEKLFEPVSYGAAMTPFYSIIALWVGGVMLVTLMNCSVDRRKYPRITETQGFFGRYLIFFLIGQIQAAVVVAGDIFLLHCEPVHPWLMWLSASVTSMVFVALIYALTLAFGDIGRAAVIVIMMIQIAGSSGTYPIEILPDIFEKIYKFFPFPYAINSMREAICGMYGHNFLICLLQLMIFFLCAVVIGIFVRRPFIGVKQFMYDKMKETEVM